ncbi:MAG: hypothetical protein D6820_01025 [Lentisphaerae bacterium]|nr:MAG: hypothetical protein D6820_01025 [Lentisphaerota bacterium]
MGAFATKVHRHAMTLERGRRKRS